MREIQNNTGVPFSPKVEPAKKDPAQSQDVKSENCWHR